MGKAALTALIIAIVLSADKSPPPVIGDVVLIVLEVATLLLNVLQSVLDNLPVFVADATGRLKVWVEVAELIAKSVPDVPVAKV